MRLTMRPGPWTGIRRVFIALALLAALLPTGTTAATPKAVQIVAGTWHACLLTDGGAVKCWGYNNLGQVGDGTTTIRTKPTAVKGLSSGVKAIAAGGLSTCALLKTGSVKCWGSAAYSEKPVKIDGLGAGVRAIAVGDDHACAITKAKAVKCWGWNDVGQLGTGSTDHTLHRSAVATKTLTSGVTALGSHMDTTCAVKSGGLWCWGAGTWGQIGDGHTVSRTKPTKVSGLTSGVSRVAPGTVVTCALRSGAVKCWGAAWGIGDPSATDTTKPVQVVGLTSGVKAVATGHSHACAITSVRALLCWGSNDFAQVGADEDVTSNHPTPTQVKGLTSGIKAVAGGQDSTCAITTAGKAWCWGRNDMGQLGDGTKTNRSTPVHIKGF